MPLIVDFKLRQFPGVHLDILHLTQIVDDLLLVSSKIKDIASRSDGINRVADAVTVQEVAVGRGVDQPTRRESIETQPGGRIGRDPDIREA